ncbi:MAG: hypothetical protein J1F11_09630 [Oscillospiraceae bacterium]|nr:hypothetical protein [Oscillospiraceae bacterium]
MIRIFMSGTMYSSKFDPDSPKDWLEVLFIAGIYYGLNKLSEKYLSNMSDDIRKLIVLLVTIAISIAVFLLIYHT